MPSRVPAERLLRSSRQIHRTTQELSSQVAELDAALTRDETARFQQALGAQQRVRIATIVALAVAAILLRSGNLTVIATVVFIAGAFVVGVLRVGNMAAREEPPIAGLTIYLAATDAIAVTVICAIAAAGGASDALMWILIAGAMAAPAMAFAFGNRGGIVSLTLFAAGYIAVALLFTGLHIGAASGMTSVATVALWGAGVWMLTRYFSVLRQRLDWLRTYAKLAEVGEAPGSEMVAESQGSDDFALLARSFDAIHSRLYDQIGSDMLTGCANRRGLEKQLLGMCRLARRREGIVAIAAIDIDHFKQINDTHGHPEGDRVLRQVATIMMNTARDTDAVARLGGDEFVIVLPDSDWRGARAFAERLRERVSQATFGPPGAAINVTISVGVAVAEGKAQLDPDRLLSEADQALYNAKAGGRNQVAAVGGARTSSMRVPE